MTTETEESPRKIAEAFIEKWANYANSVDAVEQLLISRDERAAMIAENDDFTHSSGYRCHRGKSIASAIRGKS
jgi:hypothetical protein